MSRAARFAGPLAAATLGALLARAARPALATAIPRDILARTNHTGHEVSLLEGPALVIAAGAAATLAGPGPSLSVLAAGALGAVDDLAEDSTHKGLKGHLGALASGRLTTGSVKVLGLAATGLAATRAIDGSKLTLGGAVLGTAIIAGAANVANLLDLRPGRTLKSTLAVSIPLMLAGGSSATAAAAAVGAAASLLPEDLAGETMLGDTGANAAGALVGSALVAGMSTRGRCITAAVLAGLTLASERVSFTTIIESTPGLREVDAWGR
ncbi:MAG: hypothetical protein ACK5MP_03730 [Nostocoides sp.]